MSHIYVTNAMNIAICACHIIGLKREDIYEVLDYVDFLKSEINANLDSKLNIDLDKFRVKQPQGIIDIINGKVNSIDTSQIVSDSLTAMDPSTQLMDLLALGEHESATVRRSLAQNPSIPVDLMLRLAQDKDFTVRSGLALNSGLAIDVQRVLSRDKDSFVRKALSSNKIISNEVLNILIEDQDKDVREVAIARHPLTSRQKLLELSKSQDPEVRTAIVRNINAPEAVLLYLSNDEEASVKNALLDRQEPTYKSLIILSKDGNEEISSRAKNILEESVGMIDSRHRKDFKCGGHLYVLMNPSMPGIIKIGKTIRQADERASELSGHTGVPTPFVVVYEQHFKELDSAEHRIHALLSEYRVAQNREFFKISSSKAIKVMMSLED